MTYYFFFSLIIFLIINFLYIFNLFNFLFFKSNKNTKLKKYVNSNNKIKLDLILRIKSLYNYIRNNYNFCIKNLIFSFIFSFFNYSFLYSFFNSNFIPIRFFYKTVDLVTNFEKLFSFLKIFYLIISFHFFIIINSYVYKKLLYKTYKLNNVENVDEHSIILGDYIDNVDNQKQCIIKERGLYQNILITGSIGSGKTSSAIYNILKQLLNQGLGGIILDVKGNMLNNIKKILKENNRLNDLKVITVDGEYLYNPLNKLDLNAGEIANRLKNVLELLSTNNNSDTYWLDKAATSIECFIILVRFYNKVVNFEEINKLVSDNYYLDKVLNYIKENILKNKYNEEELFKLNYAINYIKNEYQVLDSRVLSIIKSEITRITAPFLSDYKVYKSFCKSNKKEFRIDIRSKDIVIFSVNINEYKYIARIISTYLKQDYQSYVLNNIKTSTPCFFLCDEYQEFATKDDANFLSLSREAKCINIISMQSYSSLKNTLKDEDATKIIIQSCINKIWFRNDDIYTIEEIIKQIGKCEIEKETKSYNENPKLTSYNIFTNSYKNKYSNISESYSVAKLLEYRYNEKFFTQELKTFEALVFISDGINISFPQKILLKGRNNE